MSSICKSSEATYDITFQQTTAPPMPVRTTEGAPCVVQASCVWGRRARLAIHLCSQGLTSANPRIILALWFSLAPDSKDAEPWRWCSVSWCPLSAIGRAWRVTGRMPRVKCNTRGGGGWCSRESDEALRHPLQPRWAQTHKHKQN